VADTLKRAWDDDDRVGVTVARSRMWQAQTPQMFRIGLLRDALMAAESAGESVTDEASAVESLGHAPRLVRGDMENLKVTFPPDFALAARLLRTR
jgi:2-C-methyl-D-erythritol 4-phosphate cytidylyltransferase